LADVAVYFHLRGEKHVGVGKTKPDGTFTLENGALPGENHVYFSEAQGQETVDPAVLEAQQAAGISPQKKQSRIPAKYTDGTNPALTFRVPAGGTKEANFELTSR
jgi:hypothetical protein